jgi:hypothetical protein
MHYYVSLSSAGESEFWHVSENSNGLKVTRIDSDMRVLYIRHT